MNRYRVGFKRNPFYEEISPNFDRFHVFFDNEAVVFTCKAASFPLSDIKWKFMCNSELNISDPWDTSKSYYPSNEAYIFVSINDKIL